MTTQEASENQAAHKVVSVEDRVYPLIKVTCSCGYWQQIRRMGYFEQVWIDDHKDLILLPDRRA